MQSDGSRTVERSGLVAKIVAKIVAMVVRHSVLLRNAGALTVGTMATAVLGFFYWWFAARHFSAQAVGYAAAAISLMSLLAQMGELGMGTLLIGEVPKIPAAASSLISAALLTVVGSTATLGIVYLLMAARFSFVLGSITGSMANAIFFMVGLSVTGFILVLDQAFVALLRSALQMYRNIAFASIKLALLLGIAFASSIEVTEAGIFSTWIVGQVASLAVVAAVISHGGRRFWHRPRVSVLRPLLGQVLRHHILNIVIQAPSLLLPFIVTVMLSPQINAAFYAAWTLTNVVLLVPACFCVVLYSVGTREPALFAGRLKFSLGLSTLLGLGAGCALLVLSQFILGLFNPAYPGIAGASLQLLGFGTLGVMLKYHYVMIQRLRYRMMLAAALLALGGALEISAAIAGARYDGLIGLTEAWLIAVAVEAILMSPVIVSAVRFGAHVPPVAAIKHDQSEVTMGPLSVDHVAAQRAG
jgi:O-antigen/teichoic acid export membrane protein